MSDPHTPPYAEGFRVIPQYQGGWPGDFELTEYPGEVWDLDDPHTEEAHPDD